MRLLPASIITGFLIFFNLGAFAQSKPAKEPPYYTFFPKTVLIRLYAVQKYSTFRISSGENTLRFQPNIPMAIGIGFSYNSLAFNFAFAPGFLKDKDKGNTKKYDLQAHIYSRRWNYDVYGQWHKGFYMGARSAIEPGSEGYYMRPDIQTLHLGFALYRVFNSTRFSHRAAFLQTERQERSAGTLLAGAGIHYSTIKGDSSLIPFSVKEDFAPQDISKVNFINLTPGIGYAYTLVIKKHFFMTASATINLNIKYANVSRVDDSDGQLAVSPGLGLRTAAGYNGDRWAISANWITANLPFTGPNAPNRYGFNTGNYRLTVARRFKAGKKLQKRLKVVDKFFKEGISKAQSLPLVPGN